MTPTAELVKTIRQLADDLDLTLAPLKSEREIVDLREAATRLEQYETVLREINAMPEDDIYDPIFRFGACKRIAQKALQGD